MKMTESDYDAVLQTNLKGTFNGIRFASRQMLRQKSGRIINISSVSGILGNAGQANYSASKAGVIGLTKSAARELASRGITAVSYTHLLTFLDGLVYIRFMEGQDQGLCQKNSVFL